MYAARNGAGLSDVVEAYVSEHQRHEGSYLGHPTAIEFRTYALGEIRAPAGTRLYVYSRHYSERSSPPLPGGPPLRMEAESYGEIHERLQNEMLTELLRDLVRDGFLVPTP